MTGLFKNQEGDGRLGDSVGWASDFGSGHDLTVCEFEPLVLTAHSLEPALDSASPSLSLCSSPAHALSLSVSKINFKGAPGWRSRLGIRLQPGHDLAVREFKPCVRLWADGSEPGACFRFCVSFSLCPSPVHALSLSVPKINKR